jgi:hypothetical protein
VLTDSSKLRCVGFLSHLKPIFNSLCINCWLKDLLTDLPQVVQHELISFTVLALASAMLSNVSSAARGVLSKKTMSGKKIGENLDAQNLYAVLTAMSTLILLPFMLAIEGTGFLGAFDAVVNTGEFTKKSLATLVALSGATYYAYNEVAFLALGKVCWSARLFTIVLFERLMHFFFIHV